MEIHSSSLAFYPLAPTRLSGAQENNVKTTTNKEPGNEQNQRRAENPAELDSPANRRPQQNRQIARPVQENSEPFSASSRAQKALNAYINTVNQANDEKGDQSAGIDFFV